jgi:metal-responsive CopG/Arc/MetJ family transcriptional regulator
MSKRIKIMLPEKTLAVLDRVAPKGNRSSFVSAAVLHYVETQGKQSLREQLKAGYLANADEYSTSEKATSGSASSPNSATKVLLGTPLLLDVFGAVDRTLYHLSYAPPAACGIRKEA